MNTGLHSSWHLESDGLCSAAVVLVLLDVEHYGESHAPAGRQGAQGELLAQGGSTGIVSRGGASASSVIGGRSWRGLEVVQEAVLQIPVAPSVSQGFIFRYLITVS